MADEEQTMTEKPMTEARIEWEAAQKERLERQAEELKEYQESRKEEIEKENAEIEALRAKRVERQKAREEEEKRLVELRAKEEIKRKAEEAERKKLKEEEEAKAKEDREKKRKEAEERMKPKGRNFKVSKKSESEKFSLDSVMSKEELQKSKEQLEEEKQAILAQRIQPCVTEGLAADKLIEKAKELQEHIRRLEGDKYDLEQRYKRQQYDMIELAERSRQMNKGKGRGTGVQVDESFDRLADKFTSAPPKILLCSKYERHTDHRSYGDRITHFEELAKEPPPPVLNRVGGGGGEGEEEEEE